MGRRGGGGGLQSPGHAPKGGGVWHSSFLSMGWVERNRLGIGSPLSMGSNRRKRKVVGRTRLEAATEATMAKAVARATRLVITRPDDWHLHVRDGTRLASVVPQSAAWCARAIVMPNTTPPITDTRLALAYRNRIRDAVPDGNQRFEPLMTLYLTDKTPVEEIAKAKEAGVAAVKLYPAGATTNSDNGVKDIRGRIPILEEMARVNMPLCVHGEVVDANVDIFDREKVFIDKILQPLLERVPHLKVIMEHITTKDAAEFVAQAPERVAATITPQHLLLNRNDILVGGIKPHHYCLPILKRETHRQALLGAIASGSPRFFLGTDSAPHPKGAKESACGCAGIYSAHAAIPLYAMAFEEAGALDKLEAFASFNGPAFYDRERNQDHITLVRKKWRVPDSYDFGDEEVVVPLWAGKELEWAIEEGIQE